MSTLEVKAIQAPSGFDLQMPAGHIMQVVSADYVTEGNSTSTSFVSIGLTAPLIFSKFWSEGGAVDSNYPDFNFRLNKNCVC